MQIKNVYYAERPEPVIVNIRGERAMVEIPDNVKEVETEDGKQYIAESVYAVETFARNGLKEHVLQNRDAWIDVAKVVEPLKTSLSDVVDALNALTDLIVGGE